MLKFDLTPLLKLHGAKTAAVHLWNCGFSKGRARHLVSKDLKIIAISDIEKLCYTFNCTPNDLFNYEEAVGKPLPQNSALKNLVREQIPTVPELVRGLTAEDAKELMIKLADIRNQK
jgi:hypothetical protein